MRQLAQSPPLLTNTTQVKIGRCERSFHPPPLPPCADASMPERKDRFVTEPEELLFRDTRLGNAAITSRPPSKRKRIVFVLTRICVPFFASSSNTVVVLSQQQRQKRVSLRRRLLLPGLSSPRARQRLRAEAAAQPGRTRRSRARSPLRCCFCRNRCYERRRRNWARTKIWGARATIYYRSGC